jgi:hypothetical protein
MKVDKDKFDALLSRLMSTPPRSVATCQGSAISRPRGKVRSSRPAGQGPLFGGRGSDSETSCKALPEVSCNALNALQMLQ